MSAASLSDSTSAETHQRAAAAGLLHKIGVRLATMRSHIVARDADRANGIFLRVTLEMGAGRA